MMHCYLFVVPAAADLELIILYFPPEHTHSALYSPHSIDTHCLGAPVHSHRSDTHLCLRRVMSLLSQLFSREAFWVCWQGNPALHSMDTPTLPIWLNTSFSLPRFRLLHLLNLLKLYFSITPIFFSACHYINDALTVYLFLLFLWAELIQDFHSWLADLKAELKECFNLTGDVTILGAKLQRLKVWCIVLL